MGTGKFGGQARTKPFRDKNDLVGVDLESEHDGILDDMKTTIDAAGRVVIPKEIRALASLGPGAAVDIRFEDGVVQIEPLLVPMRLVQEGQFLVARPELSIPPLSLETVELTLEAVRRERGGLG